MESSPKHQQLNSAIPHEDYDEYGGDYDTSDDQEDVMNPEDDEVGDEEEEEDENDLDADLELRQRRAQLDYKLKSRFESIFEKYGRDFSGIADEIDLNTGEIVVDNGHIAKMQDERDAGTTRGNLLRAFTQEPGSKDEEANEGDEELEDILASIEGDAESIDEVGSDEAPNRHESMMQHQIGLGAVSRDHSQKQITPFRESEHLNCRNGSDSVNSTTLPSEADILAQFGPQFGPRIAAYVHQQCDLDTSTVEPAWRTPGLPITSPGKRPVLRSILLEPDTDRSPSPIGSSIWAPMPPPGRPRRNRMNGTAFLRGETIVRDTTWHSREYIGWQRPDSRDWENNESDQRVLGTPIVGSSQSSSVTRQLQNTRTRPDAGLSVDKPPRKSRVLFTESDRQLIIEWVIWAQEAGYPLWAIEHWRLLETKAPYHAAEMYRKYYRHNLFPIGVIDTSLDEGNTGANNSQPRVIGLSGNGPEASTSMGLHKSQYARPGLRNREHTRRRWPKAPWSKEDDALILEWVVDAQRRGFGLWSRKHWRRLAEKAPHHTPDAYLTHYRNKIWPKGVLDPTDMSAPRADSTDSSSSHIDRSLAMSERRRCISKLNYTAGVPALPKRAATIANMQEKVEPTCTTRLLRIRQAPRQKPGIVSWTEAIEALEDTDPTLHAGILEDVKAAERTENYARRRRTVSSVPEEDTTDSPDLPLHEISQFPRLEPGDQLQPSLRFPSSIPNSQSSAITLQSTPIARSSVNQDSMLLEVQSTQLCPQFLHDTGVTVPGAATYINADLEPASMKDGSDAISSADIKGPLDSVTSTMNSSTSFLSSLAQQSVRPTTIHGLQLHLDKGNDILSKPQHISSTENEVSGQPGVEADHVTLAPKAMNTAVQITDEVSCHLSTPDENSRKSVSKDQRPVDPPLQLSQSPKSKEYEPHSDRSLRPRAKGSQLIAPDNFHNQGQTSTGASKQCTTSSPQLGTTFPQRKSDQVLSRFEGLNRASSIVHSVSPNRPAARAGTEATLAEAQLSMPSSVGVTSMVETPFSTISPVDASQSSSTSLKKTSRIVPTLSQLAVRSSSISALSTPEPRSSKMSELIDDEEDELSLLSPDVTTLSTTPSFRAKPATKVRKAKHLLKRLFDEARTSDCSMTPKSNKRLKNDILHGDMASNVLVREGSPLIVTPGGSKRRCGESGFRCGKDFCFTCE